MMVLGRKKEAPTPGGVIGTEHSYRVEWFQRQHGKCGMGRMEPGQQYSCAEDSQGGVSISELQSFTVKELVG
jgi:hypothetical protein